MVNKCVVVGCDTGYKKRKRDVSTEDVIIIRKGSFHFPKNNKELFQKWTKFVSRKDWAPSDNSVICSEHFESRFILRGKRIKLNWELNPVPSIYPENFTPQSSLLPSILSTAQRKYPKDRTTIPDEYDEFLISDKIISFDSLNESHSPIGFTFQKITNRVIYFNLDMTNPTCPHVNELIQIDNDLHVKLFYQGSPVPLPPWFRQGTFCKLKSVSMLHNLPSYIRNQAEEMGNNILSEMKSIQYIKPKGRPAYSPEIIRFALIQRYTSRQAYNLLCNELPLPSISLLQKLTKGGIDPIKSLKRLLQEEKVDPHCILIIDEMYLQKSAQYHSGKFVGKNDDGELYNGIVVFMIVGIRKTIPYVIKSLPEIKVTGKWLSEQIYESIDTLLEAGFYVRAVITDNHPSNVSAFADLKKSYSPNKSTDDRYINHSSHESLKIYLFYDSVHILKNIRNNLLNSKRFIFPYFFYDGNFQFKIESGEINWALLHSVHDKDKSLESNLRKASKLTYETLHPGNKKQNVQLALNLFSEETIAALKSYYPNREDAAGFLQVIHNWWVMSNSKQRFNSHNKMGNAMVAGDGKTDFFRKLASWLDDWQKSQISCSQKYTLTKQTCSALITTLNAMADLCDELLGEGFSYILTARFQSDPLERRFSAYRQMSGGRFLVSLREVITSEKILAFKSLLKEGLDIENLNANNNLPDKLKILRENVKMMENEIQEHILSKDSKEVAVFIAGYISKKLKKKIDCSNCLAMFIGNNNDTLSTEFLSLISRGGLMIPSQSLGEYVCKGFSVLDVVGEMILRDAPNDVRICGEDLLRMYCDNVNFSCELHTQKVQTITNRIITNIFFNNKQKIMNSEIRRDNIEEFKSRQLRKKMKV